MRLISASLILVLSGAGCIDVRQSEAVDVDRPDVDLPDVENDDVNTSADAALDIDTAEVAPPQDVDDGADGRISTDVPVISHACLPQWCAAPGEDCALKAGWCWIDAGCVANGDRNPVENCNFCDADANAIAWTSSPGGSACDDGLSCTKNDACVAGTCLGTTDCPAPGQTCRVATCDAAADACVNSVSVGWCFINETCLAEGTTTGDGCGLCDPERSQDAWTLTDGFDPDDTPADARILLLDPALLITENFNEGWQGPRSEYRIVPVDDIDMFQFSYQTTNFGTPRPWGRVTTDGKQKMRVCIHLRCGATDNGDAAVVSRVCAPGGSVAVGPDADGWLGCCLELAAENIDVGFQSATCSVNGRSVVAPMHVRLDVKRVLPATEPACLPYELRWGLRN
jgi:hypothetical protein